MQGDTAPRRSYALKIDVRRACYYPLAGLAWLRGLLGRTDLSPAGFSGVHAGLRSADAREMYALHGWRPHVFQRGPSRHFLVPMTDEERAADEAMARGWMEVADEAQRDRWEEEAAEAACWDRWAFYRWHSEWRRAPWARD